MTTHRTRYLFSILFVAVFAAVASTPAQAQLGIAGGLNFESTEDIEAMNASASLSNSTGYHVGLVYEWSFGPLNLRPGFIYRRVGEFELSNVPSQLEDARYTVSAWEVPVDLRLSVFALPVISPYVLAGPKATIPRGEGDFDGAMKEISYVLNVGVGAQISLPASSLRLQPELRYEFGATGFIDEDSEVTLGDQGFTFSPRESPKFSTIALRLNILF